MSMVSCEPGVEARDSHSERPSGCHSTFKLLQIESRKVATNRSVNACLYSHAWGVRYNRRRAAAEAWDVLSCYPCEKYATIG